MPNLSAHDLEDTFATGEGQAAKVLPAPVMPSQAEIEAHEATHIPYRTWCKWCLQGRRPNPQHTRSKSPARDIPLLVGDYCFVRDSRDEDLLTLYVGKLYPSRAVVAIPVQQKGHDAYGCHRLANFLRQAWGPTRCL